MRSGFLRENLSGEMAYQSFVPASLPPSPPVEIDEEMQKLLVKVHASVAKIDAVAENIPDIDLFVGMYIRKESVLSSQIEGTQATLEDILDPEIEQNQNQDIKEVIRYIQASDYAYKRMNELPLSLRLLREVHEILLKSGRGKEKNPGEFRTSQNWIGPQGSSLKNASYIPPNVADMRKALNEWERYLHDDSSLDIFIKLALIHYQFETIHPFLDGNGRIGRLLLNIYLIQEEVIHLPVLYLSYFLKQNRIEYYDRMMEVRRKGSYEQWIKFFLQVVFQTADAALVKILTLRKLHEKNMQKIQSVGRVRENVQAMFLYLESHPIIEVNITAKTINLSYTSANTAVTKLVDLGIIEQSNKGRKRNRIYIYSEYLKILDEE